MKRITVVNQYVTYLTIDVIHQLHQKGWEVRLITGFIQEGEKPLPEAVKITRSIGYNRSSKFFRGLTWGLFFLINSVRILFVRETLLIVSNPPFMSFIVPLYRKFTGRDVYLLIFDVYPEALQHFGMFGSGSMLYKFWGNYNKSIYNRANVIFTLSNSMADEIRKYLGNNGQSDLHVVYPWKDGNHLKPLDKAKNAFIEAHELSGKFIVLYSGNMGITHDLETVFLSAVELRKFEAIHFVFIGGGAQKKTLIRRSTENRLTNVSFFDWQPVDQLPFTFAAADVAIVSQSSGIESLSIPSKTFSYLSVGAAIIAIATPSSELGSIITEYKCGQVVNPGDVQTCSKFIHEMYINTEMREQYQRNSLRAAENFTVDNVRKIIDAIRDEI